MLPRRRTRRALRVASPACRQLLPVVCARSSHDPEHVEPVTV